MSEVCEQCGREFEGIGSHWMQSSCSYPALTDHQKEIIVGLLMGDGSLNRYGKNPRLQCNMISLNYLEYLDEQFGVLGTGVSLQDTAEESAKNARDSGFRPNAVKENYSDVYRWQSRSHSELHEYNWYTSGEKVWPKTIDLTPTVLNHWYSGDGNCDNSGPQGCIRIAMANEVENQEKVNQIFENAGLPSPSNYAISDRNDGSSGCNAQFTVEQSKELWNYMGEPLPDFEYKWPEQYR